MKSPTISVLLISLRPIEFLDIFFMVAKSEFTHRRFGLPLQVASHLQTHEEARLYIQKANIQQYDHSLYPLHNLSFTAVALLRSRFWPLSRTPYLRSLNHCNLGFVARLQCWFKSHSISSSCSLLFELIRLVSATLEIASRNFWLHIHSK